MKITSPRIFIVCSLLFGFWQIVARNNNLSKNLTVIIGCVLIFPVGMTIVETWKK